MVTEERRLAAALELADLVITGEGRFDAGSFDGKVVEGVADLTQRNCAVLVVAGVVDGPIPDRIRAVSLSGRFGLERSHGEPLACVNEVVSGVLASAHPLT